MSLFFHHIVFVQLYCLCVCVFSKVETTGMLIMRTYPNLMNKAIL